MLQWLLVPVGLPLSIRMETIVAGNGMCTGMTSRPMPSPGINPIRSDLDAIGERGEARVMWAVVPQLFFARASRNANSNHEKVH